VVPNKERWHLPFAKSLLRASRCRERKKTTVVLYGAQKMPSRNWAVNPEQNLAGVKLQLLFDSTIILYVLFE